MGKKAASSAEARFASCGVVHLVSRWRGLGVVVGAGAAVADLVIIGGGVEVEVEVDVRGRWMLGMDGCFGHIAGGFVGVLVVDVVFRFCF